MTTGEIDGQVGDTLVIEGRHVGDQQRSGEILEVLGGADHHHYLVRWEDGHESIFYPSNDATIRQAVVHHPRRARRAGKPKEG